MGNAGEKGTERRQLLLLVERVALLADFRLGAPRRTLVANMGSEKAPPAKRDVRDGEFDGDQFARREHGRQFEAFAEHMAGARREIAGKTMFMRGPMFGGNDQFGDGLADDRLPLIAEDRLCRRVEVDHKAFPINDDDAVECRSNHRRVVGFEFAKLRRCVHALSFRDVGQSRPDRNCPRGA